MNDKIATAPMMFLTDLGVDLNLIQHHMRECLVDFEDNVGDWEQHVFGECMRVVDELYSEDRCMFERMLNMGEHIRNGSFGPLIESLIFCSSGLHMLRTMMAIQHFFVQEPFEVQESQELVTVRWGSGKSLLLSWAYLAYIQMLIDRIYPGQETLPCHLYYARASGFDDIVAAKFQCPLVKSDHFQLVYNKADLLKPVQSSNEVFAQSIFATYIEQNSQSDAHRLNEMREKLDNLIVAGEASLESLSATFFVTPRTMQRRLKQCGVTFAQLLQQEKERMAKYLLTNRNHSLTDIAEKLNYNDPTTFSRAFKNWTGQSPSDFRRSVE